jgi:hypothetical protein
MAARKIGEIRISDLCYEDNPYILAWIFAHVRVRRMEMDVYSPTYRIWCESEHFQDVSEGDVAPWYMVDLEEDRLDGVLVGVRGRFSSSNYHSDWIEVPLGIVELAEQHVAKREEEKCQEDSSSHETEPTKSPAGSSGTTTGP